MIQKNNKKNVNISDCRGGICRGFTSLLAVSAVCVWCRGGAVVVIAGYCRRKVPVVFRAGGRGYMYK